jgi:hypothetical protein
MLAKLRGMRVMGCDGQPGQPWRRIRSTDAGRHVPLEEFTDPALFSKDLCCSGISQANHGGRKSSAPSIL